MTSFEGQARLDRSVGRAAFGKDAEGYNAGRLGYPSELYEFLFARTGPPGSLNIVESGAGTGLATRELLERSPARLVAVEPDTRLAQFLADNVAASDRLEIITAPFEEADLPLRAFELAVAAASFHWLDPTIALSRLREVLKPSGTLALWWNVYRARGIGDAFADALFPLLAGIPLPPSEGAHTHHSLDVDWHRNLLEENGFGAFEKALFRRERMLDAGQMRALYESYSFVRELDPESRARLLDGIVHLVETQFGGQAPNIVLTPIYVVRLDPQD